MNDTAFSDSQTILQESTPPISDAAAAREHSTFHSSVRASQASPKVLTQPPRPSFLSRTRAHLLDETVRPCTLTEVELLILTFCTGIQDAVSFLEFHCFASNQTGNTIFLSMSLLLPDLGNGTGFYTSNIAVALTLFLAGAYFTGQTGHRLGNPCLRLWLVFINALQTLLVLAAAIVQFVQLTAIKKNKPLDEQTPSPTGPVPLIVLALLAFASGSQVVQSRSLRTTEISTAMATAAWVDLLIDPRLLVFGTTPDKINRARNRRLAFLAMLVAGSLVGAAVARTRTAGSTMAVFVSAGGKAVVTGMYFFNGSGESRERGREAAVAV